MIRYNIVVVGCGGTGGNFIARISQFLSTARVEYNLTLVDGDYVDEGNLSRQPFTRDELTCNKAVSLASAVFDTYGFKPVAYPQYLDTYEDLKKVFELITPMGYCRGEKVHTVDILIGCCDNHRCRQVMEKWFDKATNAIYLDAANEFSCGEVVIGIKAGGKILAPSRKFYFPEVMRDRKKRKSKESCGAVNKSAPQHLATNTQAANILLAILSNFIQTGEIAGGVVYFDTFKFSQVFRAWDMERGVSDVE